MSKAALSIGSNVNGSLKWEVFVAPGIPAAASDLPPGTKQGMWSPISSTLIYGKRDAVLVDAFITVEHAHALVDWVEASGKNLTTIYATHGHGDHFFGVGALLDRFPNARAVATSDVVNVMRQQASPQSLASFWNPFFPGRISNHLVIAEELTENVIDLEHWRNRTSPRSARRYGKGSARKGSCKTKGNSEKEPPGKTVMPSEVHRLTAIHKKRPKRSYGAPTD